MPSAVTLMHRELEHEVKWMAVACQVDVWIFAWTDREKIRG
jgi:P2-related tail formation protein